MGQRLWGNRSNCNGTGAQEQGQQDSDCNGATGRWRLCVCCIAAQTSTIVVDETVQNVWTAIIRDVLRWNKTCMICSGIVFVTFWAGIKHA
jgi:hypothetical protein